MREEMEKVWNGEGDSLFRIAVPGGWLYSHHGQGRRTTTFVPHPPPPPPPDLVPLLAAARALLLTWEGGPRDDHGRIVAGAGGE